MFVGLKTESARTRWVVCQIAVTKVKVEVTHIVSKAAVDYLFFSSPKVESRGDTSYISVKKTLKSTD